MTATSFPDAMDDAIVVDANSVYDAEYMRAVDAKLQGLGRGIVAIRTASYTAVWPKADPDSPGLAARTVVAIKGSAEPVMVAATTANLAAGATVLGLLVAATPPGARGPVAIVGLVPPELTGVTAAGPVGADGTTGLALLGATAGIIGVARGDGSLILTSGGASAGTVSASQAVTDGATITYTSTGLRFLNLTGVLAGDASVVKLAQLSAAEPDILVRNSTTGGHLVNVRSTAGGDLGEDIPAQTTKHLAFNFATGKTEAAG